MRIVHEWLCDMSVKESRSLREILTYNEKSPDGVVEEHGRGDDEHCEADETIELFLLSDIQYTNTNEAYGIVCGHIVCLLLQSSISISQSRCLKLLQLNILVRK